MFKVFSKLVSLKNKYRNLLVELVDGSKNKVIVFFPNINFSILQETK